MSEDKFRVVRVRKEMYALFEELAEEEDTTVTDQIEKACEQFLNGLD